MAKAGMPDDRDVAAGRGPLDRPPSLVDKLAQRLQADIRAGRYPPGSRLPAEQTMCALYRVSRATVREAVGRLKHDGLVASRQGAGAFIAESGLPAVFRLDIADFSDAQEIRNIVELLIAVEAAASEHAARRRTAGDLEIIRARLEAMQTAIDRNEPGVDEDLTFHRSIIEATHNPFFCDLSDFLDQRVRRFIRTARANSARFLGLTQAVQGEHQAIFAAIASGDGPGARAAAERHLRNAAARLELYLER